MLAFSLKFDFMNGTNKNIFNIFKLTNFFFNYSTISDCNKTCGNEIDETQQKFLKDQLILVDKKDNEIGTVSKLDGHLISKKNLFPHRAFSVFLFDKNNNMLLQQRSHKKVTFPLLWTNSCCSHPLNIPSENKPEKILNAVNKRVKFELGLDTSKKIYKLIDKILYRAPSDKTYEEYEVDYLFLAKIFDENFFHQNILNNVNKDEVENIKLMKIKDILDDIEENPEKYTPWFKIVMKSKFNEMNNFLEEIKGEEKIENIKNNFKNFKNGHIKNFIKSYI